MTSPLGGNPKKNDVHPMLTTEFMLPSTVSAIRLVWRDVGLDSERGKLPGAFQYRVELETSNDQWQTVIDRSQSNEGY